ncbi:MAG: HEAT repeat domain-containing protein [Methanosarcina flavescens]|uniref:HEAT repeat domain-containing protein n=1 Tax=Methanosarcina flavescens TaxID=1715806 RepID=UPI0006C76956|nr:HEAT repeat domain-containing protein [Methanosarcina flavescens]
MVDQNNIHNQCLSKDPKERIHALEQLENLFSFMPDKQQAWDDLHRLTSDEDIDVRSSAALALGSAFSHVPDKQQAWDYLHRLTSDEDRSVRSSSNYSLARVSIFMASQAETDEDYKRELENAIEFFEIASKEAKYYNPAQFCLLFYRSFYTVIFKKQEAREEVNRYLEEAKSAIKGSESKELLSEAVQNLAEALKEVHNLENLDLKAKKVELYFYRKYCDSVSEIMRYTDEKAPFATEVLRKRLPILDRHLKKLLEEIQEKAKKACQESQGTATKEIACAVNKEVQKWEISSHEEMSWCVNNLVTVLKSKIPHNTENKEILDMIEYMKFEKDLTKQYRTLSTVIGLIPTVNVVAVDPIVENINEIGQNIEAKLDNLSQEMNDISISLSPRIKQEIKISSGIEIAGTGGKLITTIPLQEISYAELKEDLQRIKGKNISKLSELPKRLANKIKGYLLLKDREDIIEQLT